ncbi:Probable AMP deaminase [Linum grandiflorum]
MNLQDADARLQSGADNHNSCQYHNNIYAGDRPKASSVYNYGREMETIIVHPVETDSCVASLLPMTIVHDSINAEEEEVRKLLRECLDLRSKYVYKENVAPWTKVAEKVSDTPQAKSDPFYFEPVSATKDNVEFFPVASAKTFFTDMHHIMKVISVGNVRTTCYHILRFFEEKFRLHLLVNADREFLAQKGAPHRDFYNIRKVDTHVHHLACMNQKHLLRFIKSKLKKEPDEVYSCYFQRRMYMTLKEVFESLDLTGLREIFLKQDNLIQAEVTKEVLADLEASKYQMAEYMISIYGRKQSEWDQLGSWFVNNQIYSENAVWLIQGEHQRTLEKPLLVYQRRKTDVNDAEVTAEIPMTLRDGEAAVNENHDVTIEEFDNEDEELSDLDIPIALRKGLPQLTNVYKEMGIVNSFQNILDNVFLPLFEVTVDPNSHPQLHMFLMHVGFSLIFQLPQCMQFPAFLVLQILSPLNYVYSIRF